MSRLATPVTILDWVHHATRRMRRAQLWFGHGTTCAEDESAWLVSAAMDISPARLTGELARRVGARQATRIEQLLRERIRRRRPLAYLLGEAWYHGLRFHVTDEVLVPRSLLGEHVLGRFEPWVRPARVRRVLEIGTGSGCLAVMLAKAFPQASIDATDVSDAALQVAARNCGRYRLRSRIHLVKSDVYDGLGGRRYDLIVTNPPYASAREMKSLPAEYGHEPALALGSGRDGLDTMRRILDGAVARLKPHGWLIAELGNSADRLERLCPDMPWIRLVDDAGDPSVLMISREALERQRCPKR